MEVFLSHRQKSERVAALDVHKWMRFEQELKVEKSKIKDRMKALSVLAVVAALAIYSPVAVCPPLPLFGRQSTPLQTSVNAM